MITVHHLENSRSQRILWLLEELGVDYNIKHYKRNKKTNLAPPELKAVHPLGKSPVITDGDKTIAETGAIVEYLIDTYGNGRFKPAPGSDELLRYRYWLHAAEGTVMPLMVMTLIFNKIESAAPFIVRPVAKGIAGQVKKFYIKPNTQANVEHIEAELSKSPWFAGDELTGADFIMIFPIEALMNRSSIAGRCPNIKAYADRVHALPTYKSALEKGGPYALL